MEEPEATIANLLYDEQTAQISSSSSLLADDHLEEKATVVKKSKKVHPNPVFQAFDAAEGVDDLYRIAEIYVNPYYYHLASDDL